MLSKCVWLTLFCVSCLVFSFIGDLPPFGLHLFALRLRLEQCCKVIVTRECLEEHLSKYYDLKVRRTIPIPLSDQHLIIPPPFSCAAQRLVLPY
jgi:hypothetical protein